MTQWNCNPILNSYPLVALMTLGLIALLSVGPNYKQLPRIRRAVLTGLRLAVILLLLIAMLRPTLVSTSRQAQSGVLVILFDQSRSMQLPGATGSDTRWQSQQAALKSIEVDLRELSDRLQVKLYAYDQQLHPIEFGAGGIVFPTTPTGDQTDLGTTLHEAVQRELGQRVVGIIVLGDGAQTAFAPQVEVQQAARNIARMQYPLYAVAFGPAGNSAQARDVVLENLPEQYTVFVKNELNIKGSLRVRGYVNQAIPVSLIVEDPAGNKRVLGPQQVTARTEGEQIPVATAFSPDRPGQYKVTLRAADQPGELVTRNNELSAFVTVLEGGLRVLYLYGDLLGEQRLLRRSLDASADIQLEDVYVNSSKPGRDAVVSAALRFADFDVLLIENIDATVLGAENNKTIQTLVEQGKGLMMLGGFNSFGPGGYQKTPMADMLPITMGRFERQDLGPTEPISRDLHIWGDLKMRPTGDHPVTRLATGDKNIQIWNSLPPLKGANKVGVKPTGRVLADTPGGVPLLVSGAYGRGRVLAFAGNSTIRWWQFGRQSEHRRFWRQAILWLASREDLAKHDVWIKLDQRRYNPSSRISFVAGATAPTGEVITDAEFKAEIVAQDGTRQPVSLTTDDDQFIGAVDAMTAPGDYLVELSVTRAGAAIGAARTTFQILDRDVELSNPATDYPLMARIANLTKEAGGEPIAPEQLPALMKKLKDRRDELEIDVQAKWQLGDTAQDAWAMLLLLVGFLTGEWFLRKKWGLV
ncbi:MAG TPA: glutamine amidotransferase [Pirellulaceae bacterium]|jgi:uncharacterized membrane protein|nr:glutamine amidotransferase [Pirellulaceae bacterium]